MNQLLKKYPFPICGLILGMVTLGNLIKNYGEMYRTIIGFIAGILLIFLIIKIGMFWNEFKENMQNPVIAGTFATFPMALTIISTYLPKNIGLFIWILGIIIHTILILWFTKKFVLNFDIKKVFPTWFIVYVGIVTVSVTSPIYKLIGIGQVAFWFGFITYLCLLFVVCFRVFKIKNIPEPALPTLVVFSAPASLLLAGYMNAFKNKEMTIVYFLLFLSVLFYVYSLISMPKLLTLPFYPSYSAFTFPLVVSALSTKLTTKFLKEAGQNVALMAKLVSFQEIIAVLIIIYVFYCYLKFLLKK